ncbi:MAG: ATP-binding protein, partial [Candidatus Binatia bacterium]
MYFAPFAAIDHQLGATEIFIWLEKSGTVVIRITDNGAGMTPEDLALAVERHATSKLREDD